MIAKRFAQFGPADGACEGVPVTHGFAECDDIGYHTGMLMAPHSPGSTKCGLHLVKDQQSAGIMHHLRNPLQVIGWNIG